jgi:hypothetical protein
MINRWIQPSNGSNRRTVSPGTRGYIERERERERERASERESKRDQQQVSNAVCRRYTRMEEREEKDGQEEEADARISRPWAGS